MTRVRRNLLPIALVACALFSGISRSGAQAAPTAYGPGSYVSLGFTASAYQQDYGKRYIEGGTVYLDANLYRRIGVEAEFRDLAAHTSEDVKERTYLAGPKISALAHNLRPYAKLLAGRGDFDFPFHYAKGSYFVVAPGAGLDWRVGHSRLNVRVIDVEYQIWPQFTFGAMHPYGASAGFSFDLFTPESGPRGRHF